MEATARAEAWRPATFSSLDGASSALVAQPVPGEVFAFTGGGMRATATDRPERDTARVTIALFSSEKISNFGTVALSFNCDKYYLIMD